MRNLGGALVLLCATQAAADPTYARSMADGARRMDDHDYAGAVAAYKAAITASPGDPRAMSELSVAELAVGDFAGARTAAIEAVWTETHPALRAMALYNLGRAEQALGHLDEAMVAYSRSLDLRANSEVRRRLSAMAPAIFASRALAGPFSKPQDFCGSACDVEPDVDRVVDANGDDVVDLAGNVAHAAKAPFGAVAVIATDPPSEIPQPPIANLAVEVGSAWYVLPAIGAAESGHGGDFSLDVAMSGRRLVVTWKSEVGRFGHTDEVATIVCGADASQAPRCVGPIVSESSEVIDHCGKDTDCTVKPTLEVAFHCAAHVHGDAIEVTRSHTKLENFDEAVQVGPRADACESLPTFGTHVLSFSSPSRSPRTNGSP